MAAPSSPVTGATLPGQLPNGTPLPGTIRLPSGSTAHPPTVSAHTATVSTADGSTGSAPTGSVTHATESYELLRQTMRRTLPWNVNRARAAIKRIGESVG
jgi:hypothetical protein